MWTPHRGLAAPNTQVSTLAGQLQNDQSTHVGFRVLEAPTIRPQIGVSRLLVARCGRSVNLSAVKRSVILSVYAAAGVDHHDRPGAAAGARACPGHRR